MTEAIRVKNLSFAYQKKESVIVGASFAIEAQELVAIIGPNGGGKTTLLKLLMGFLKPCEGTISIFGKEPNSQSLVFGYVPQILSFDRDFPMSVLELVLGGRLFDLPWWGHFRKSDIKKAYHALDQVGLADMAKKPFGCLSGGQAQRALIARALVSEPKILIFDEPTAHVDPKNEEEIYELLAALKKKLTILVVTHHIQTLIDNVERVLCVQGRIDSMSPKELCEHFALGLYHFPLVETDSNHLATHREG